MLEEKSSQKPPREPQALSSEYHKARKQLMLWAAILFVWELVGIDLEKAKETGGNAGAIITAIKSPQAIPWVLLILVLYFLVKTTIEWHQCNLLRRSLRVSKIDYFLACGVAIAAFALYLFQKVRGVQLADKIGLGEFFLWRILTFGMALLALATAKQMVYLRRAGRPIGWRNITLLIVTAIIVGLSSSDRMTWLLTAAMELGALMWVTVVLIFGKTKRQGQ